jgi:hypothetical protein
MTHAAMSVRVHTTTNTAMSGSLRGGRRNAAVVNEDQMMYVLIMDGIVSWVILDAHDDDASSEKGSWRRCDEDSDDQKAVRHQKDVLGGEQGGVASSRRLIGHRSWRSGMGEYMLALEVGGICCFFAPGMVNGDAFGGCKLHPGNVRSGDARDLYAATERHERPVDVRYQYGEWESRNVVFTPSWHRTVASRYGTQGCCYDCVGGGVIELTHMSAKTKVDMIGVGRDGQWEMCMASRCDGQWEMCMATRCVGQWEMCMKGGHNEARSLHGKMVDAKCVVDVTANLWW